MNHFQRFWFPNDNILSNRKNENHCFGCLRAKRSVDQLFIFLKLNKSIFQKTCCVSFIKMLHALIEIYGVKSTARVISISIYGTEFSPVNIFPHNQIFTKYKIQFQNCRTTSTIYFIFKARFIKYFSYTCMHVTISKNIFVVHNLNI